MTTFSDLTPQEQEALRAKRHLAAFLGDCGQRSCPVCHPPVTFEYEGTTLRLVTSQFVNGGGLAVVVIDHVTGEPWARLSVNLPDEAPLPDGAFWLKDWSENAAMASQLVEDGVLVELDPPRMAITGQVWTEAYRIAEVAR